MEFVGQETGEKSCNLRVLHALARIGVPDDVRSHITKFEDIYGTSGENDASVMHYAATNKKHGGELVKMLMMQGLSPHVKDAGGKEPIDYALRVKNFDTAAALLQHLDRDWATCCLLHYCIKRQDLEAAKAVHEHDKTQLCAKGKCGKTALHLAAQYGDLDTCLWILESSHHARLQSMDTDTTFLHYAALNTKHAKTLIQLFISLTLDINAKNANQETPLHFALRAENIDAAKTLLRHNPELDELKDGMNALQFCVRENKFESAKIVHEHKPDLISSVTSQGSTLVHLAARYAGLEMCQWLLDQGCDPNAVDHDERSILHSVAMGEHASIELVRHVAPLMEHPFHADASKMTPLHHAIHRGKFDVAKEMIGLGADLGAKIGEKNPLHYFISLNKHDAAMFVLKNDVQKVNELGPDGESALQCAASTADERMCELLIKAGCDVHFQLPNKMTILHFATGNRDYGEWVIRFLLKSSFLDVNSLNIDNETPLHLALKNQHVEVAECLLEEGADIKVKRGQENLLHYCVIHNKLRSIKFLHRKDKELFKALDVGGKNALHLAAQHAGTEVCVWLIYHAGLDVNARDRVQATPMHYVAFRKDNVKQHLTVFSQAGLSLGAKDKHGCNVMHYALCQEKDDVVEELLSAGFNLQDAVGEHANALQLCVSMKNVTSASYVHRKDESLINHCGDSGVTAIHIAAANADIVTCKWLMSQGANLLAVDQKKNNVLHHLAQNLDPKVSDKDRNTLAGYFSLVDVNQVNEDGDTPLGVALNLKNLFVARCFFHSGADMHLTKNGTPYLHQRVYEHDLKGVQFLCEMEPSLVRRRDSEGRTALHIAAERGDLEMATWLVGSGSDVHAESERSKYSVLHFAAMNGKHGESLVRYFVSAVVPLNAKAASDVTPLHVALECKHFKVARLLTQLGADINARIGSVTNLMHYCILTNNFEGAKFVHDQNPHLVGYLAMNKRNALHLAAAYADLDFCKWLVERGVNYHDKADEGQSVLDYCKNRPDVTEFFKFLRVKKESSFKRILRNSFRRKKRTP